MSRIGLEAITGTDWAGRKFTTWRELFGVDDKGVYSTTRAGHHTKGQPKGGKLKGRVVKWQFGGGGPVSYETTPSFLIHTSRSVMPIPMQSAVSYLAGEMDGWDALTKGVGIHGSTYIEKKPKPKKKKKTGGFGGFGRF